jgi:hypothetical protein
MVKTNAYSLSDVGNFEWKIYEVSKSMWVEIEAEYSVLSSAGMRGTLL